MDPLFMAYSYFRRRKFDECLNICNGLLEQNPYDQASWSLKTRALTEQVYIDEIEVDEEGVAELVMDDSSIAQVARPGTSLKPMTSSVPGERNGPSQSFRPMTNGRPLSGFARPGTQSRLATGSLETALGQSRTSRSARPVSSASGRHIRLGTASMLSRETEVFIDLAHMNFDKYAGIPHLAKSLFEYIFLHENDVRNALDLASKATEKCEFKDWWWKSQIGKCYYRLGLYRDAEKQFESSLKQQEIVDTILYLCKVYIKLDQPLKAIELYKKGLMTFSTETTLLLGIARIYEGMNDISNSVAYYTDALRENSMCVEAIASIGTNHFYTDQPEVSLNYFRRLLQIGICTAALYNNLALCCFFSQQYDMSLNLFQRALQLVSDDLELADIWYNIGHVALGIGDPGLSYQCFRLALSNNNDHAEAYNNLGVLEMRKNRFQKARSFYQASYNLAPLAFEPHYNFASLSETLGDLQGCHKAASNAKRNYPDHTDSSLLLDKISKQFSMM